MDPIKKNWMRCQVCFTFSKLDYIIYNFFNFHLMPAPYCKQLYLDVTNSNYGKITWKHLKPIIQGKIVYGPDSERNRKIMAYVRSIRIGPTLNNINEKLIRI